MKIQVTQEHIDKGHVVRACLCPIALAVKDKGYKFASVGPTEVSYSNSQEESSTEGLPSEAIAFVQSFDSGHSVKPFEFETLQ